MPSRQLHLALTPSDEVADAFAALRAEVGLPAMFPAAVREEAQEAASNGGGAPGVDLGTRQDRRDLDLVTLDPPGSMDLDQAVHVAASGRGYLVRYAIADVAAFVRPSGAVDAESHRRGTTVYGPDTRTPLHPPVLSEGAASLLPGEDRPAVLWTISLDPEGEITSTSVTRATVRSRARLTYGEVQATLDAGTAPDSLTLLADVGRLRHERERDRGGLSLDVPEQEIDRDAQGRYLLELRRGAPVEGWNAQISLLTGIAAAAMMRDAGVGLLRTLPPADPRDVARLRHTALALGVEWPQDATPVQVLSGLETRRPANLALLTEATTLFRGADYLAFGVPGPDGAPVALPDDARHAALATEYAHVTAPLRRLADRYATEVCLAHAAGRDLPDWVAEALPALPATMAGAARTAGAFERGSVDIVEAALLTGREGETFDGVVVDVHGGGDEPGHDEPGHDEPGHDEPGHDEPVRRGEVMLRKPAVRARVDGEQLPLGEKVRVRLAEASVPDRTVRFTLA